MGVEVKDLEVFSVEMKVEDRGGVMGGEGEWSGGKVVCRGWRREEEEVGGEGWTLTKGGGEGRRMGMPGVLFQGAVEWGRGGEARRGLCRYLPTHRGHEGQRRANGRGRRKIFRRRSPTRTTPDRKRRKLLP